MESDHSPQEIGQSSLQVDKELSQQEGPPRKHARWRSVFTKYQRQELEKLFSNYHYPSTTQYQEYAKSLGLTCKQVREWFNYRRNKFRKKNCIDNGSVQNVGSSSLRLPNPLTLHQKQELEKLFENDRKMSQTQYKECAKSLGLTYQQVRKWFNRRIYKFRKENFG